jgi:murein DD-endopeptidase MepM/ murein hydrolase activator NlpD
VLHEDGTLAEYLHLREHGVLIRIGQRIVAGELIAYSGNTGWTTVPHLHFGVYMNRSAEERVSIPIVFRGPNGQALVPQERKSYDPDGMVDRSTSSWKFPPGACIICLAILLLGLWRMRHMVRNA